MSARGDQIYVDFTIYNRSTDTTISLDAGLYYDPDSVIESLEAAVREIKRVFALA